MKTQEKISPQKIKDFMKWAMENKLSVSPQSRREITSKVKALFADGSITEDELSKYTALTKASLRAM